MPNLYKALRGQLVYHTLVSSAYAKYTLVSYLYIASHVEPNIAPNKQRTSYIMKTEIIILFVNNSSLDFLTLAEVELRMIFVSWPVKVTIPVTQSVFLREEPLSKKLSLLRLIVSENNGLFNIPSNS